MFGVYGKVVMHLLNDQEFEGCRLGYRNRMGMSMLRG